MAAEYEVNIKLNTGKAETQLKNIESSVAKIGKADDRRVASLVKLRGIGDDIAAFEKKGVDMSKARNQLKKAQANIEKKMFLTANQRMGVAVKELKTQQGITKQLEQQEKARRRQRTKRAEGVALGAGFPLLFGGGPGAVLGGAAGGLTGSFGAQIAFSAIGQQIDRFIASVAAVGTALTSASGTVEMFREKNLFSSDAVKEHAFQLEEQGKMQELATLLTKDLASQIGKNAVESFQLLGGETKEFLKTINHLFLAVQGFVAGPLAKLLSAINTVLGGVSTDVQFGALRGSLTGDAAAQFEAIVAENRGTRALTGPERQRALSQGAPLTREGRLTTAVKEAVLKDPRVVKLRQSIDVTGQTTLDDTLSFKPPKDTEAAKAQREEERMTKRLANLEEERQKVLEISRFKDQIAAAEALGDTQLAIRLEGEQKMAEIEASRKAALIGVTDQREIEAINIVKATEKLAAQRETERQITEEQRRRQELFDDTVADLEYQLKISQATSEAERERLRIQKKLQELSENDATEEQIERLRQLMEELSAENSPINKFIKQSIESLTDLETQVVQISQSIGNAIGNSLVNGLQNLIDGATSVKEVFADMLMSIANILAKQAAQMIATYIAIGIARIFAGIPAGDGNAINTDSLNQIESLSGVGANTDVSGFTPRALGGAVGAGKPYLVGEKGPELFVPGAQGNIVPNNAMGGSNIVVNVDASGSNVEGDSRQQKALGKAIAAAVQSEIAKQKRPGGLLS